MFDQRASSYSSLSALCSYDEGDEIHVVNTGEEEEIKQLSQQHDLYDILSRSLGKNSDSKHLCIREKWQNHVSIKLY
jgi:aspartyl aminopeptidase